MVFLVCKNANDKQAKEFLEEGFAIDNVKSEYEEIRLSKLGASVVFYTSGKLVVQVKDEEEDRMRSILEKKGLIIEKNKTKTNQNIEYTYHNVIGTDETLKGDTFGGLIIVGAYFSEKEEEILIGFGVKDSKLINDANIKMISEMLLKRFPDRFVIEELEPSEYNMLIEEKKSATILLNYFHEKIAKKLKKHFGKEIMHLVDEYPGCAVGDKKITKAEQQSMAVAAASIVARHKALVQFERLSDQAGFMLPKGSTHVSAALEVLIKNNRDLKLFAKTSFKNVQKALNSGELSCSFE